MLRKTYVTHPPLPLVCVMCIRLADIQANTPIWLLVRLHASSLPTSVRLPCNKLYSANIHFLPFATMLVCSSVSYDQGVENASGSQSYGLSVSLSPYRVGQPQIGCLLASKHGRSLQDTVTQHSIFMQCTLPFVCFHAQM